MLNGTSWNTAQNRRTWEVPFTAQIPPVKSIRGSQNQLSGQHGKTKLACRMVERVKLCLPWANLASFGFLSATEPGIFKWQFIQRALEKLFILCSPPQKCVTIMWEGRKGKQALQKNIYTSDSLRFTTDSENAAVETRDYHSKHCSRPDVVIL